MPDEAPSSRSDRERLRGDGRLWRGTSRSILIQAQIVAAAAMTGIIWFVQRITYPQFLDASPSEFPAFHERYTTALTPIVAPLMIIELALAIASVWLFRRSPARGLIFASAALAGALWLITFFVQVPLHAQLSQGWSEPQVRKLIESNWIRTALWTTRLGLLLLITARFSCRRPHPDFF